MRFHHQCTWVFMYSTRYSCHILIFLTDFQKLSNIKIHENPVGA